MRKFLKRINISNKLKKEITRYVISFFFAWLISALISDFPLIKKHIIQSIGLDSILTDFMVKTCQEILNMAGFETYNSGKFLQILNTEGVLFNYGCLGFRELTLFIIFIILQFGSTKNKLWYIPSGIIILISLNIIRILIIIIGQFYSPDHIRVIHDIISPVIMYPAILFLWLFWISKYGKPKK